MLPSQIYVCAFMCCQINYIYILLGNWSFYNQKMFSTDFAFVVQVDPTKRLTHLWDSRAAELSALRNIGRLDCMDGVSVVFRGIALENGQTSADSE